MQVKFGLLVTSNVINPLSSLVPLLIFRLVRSLLLTMRLPNEIFVDKSSDVRLFLPIQSVNKIVSPVTSIDSILFPKAIIDCKLVLLVKSILVIDADDNIMYSKAVKSSIPERSLIFWFRKSKLVTVSIKSVGTCPSPESSS